MNYDFLKQVINGRKRLDFQLTDLGEGDVRVWIDCTDLDASVLRKYIIDRWESKFREETFDADPENYEVGVDAAKGFIYAKNGSYHIEFRLYQRADQTRWRRTYTNPEVIEHSED